MDNKDAILAATVKLGTGINAHRNKTHATAMLKKALKKLVTPTEQAIKTMKSVGIAMDNLGDLDS